jgi:hypothetical protein
MCRADTRPHNAAPAAAPVAVVEAAGALSVLRPGPLAEPAELVAALRAGHVHAALVLLDGPSADVCNGAEQGGAKRAQAGWKGSSQADRLVACRRGEGAGRHPVKHPDAALNCCSRTHVHLGQGLVFARIQFRFSLSALFLICRFE